MDLTLLSSAGRDTRELFFDEGSQLALRDEAQSAVREGRIWIGEDRHDARVRENKCPEVEGEQTRHGQAVLVAWPSRPFGRNSSATIRTMKPMASL